MKASQKLLAAGLLAMTALSVLLLLPAERWMLALVGWIRDAGSAGVVAFALSYIAAALAFFPGSLLTLAAGFAYGPLWGILLVSPVSVLAATLAFLLGRSALRDWVWRRMANSPRFSAIDRAVARDGFKVVLLLRLSPVFPFNLLNYALGLTNISLKHYVLASFLGMLPGTFLYVYLGSLITTTSELLAGDTPEAGPWGETVYFGGLLATLLVVIMVTRIARRALNQAITPEASSPPVEPSS